MQKSKPEIMRTISGFVKSNNNKLTYTSDAIVIVTVNLLFATLEF